MTYTRSDGDMIAVPFGNNNIEQGQLVTVDTSTGNAKAGEPSGKPFLGVADESTADLTTNTIKIRTEGVFQFSVDSAVASDLGKMVQVSNPTTVTKSVSSSYPVIGQIVEIVDNKTVMVKLK